MQYRFSTFADTVLSEPGIFRLMEDLDAALSGPNAKDMYMLGGGNPGFVAPVHDYFQKSFQQIANDADLFRRVSGQYDGPSGSTSFRQTLAERLHKHYGWSLTEQNIVLTQGSQNAFFLLLNLFSGPDSDGQPLKILFAQSPEYIGYENSGLHSNSMIAVPSKKIDLGNGFFRYTVDYEAITKTLQNGNIGAICISRPSNPTGGMLDDDEVAMLSKLARQFQLPLIIDGAYGDPFPGVVYGQQHPYFDDNTIFVLSLSKTGLPGLRTGIILAPARVTAVIERLQAIEHLAPNSIGPALVEGGIADGSMIRICKEHLPPFYKARKNLAVSTLFKHLQPDKQVQLHRPDGAFFVWAIFPKLKITSVELYSALKQSGVIIVPGSYYFPGLPKEKQTEVAYHNSVRISYSQNEATIKDGLEILCRIVAKYSAD